MTTDELIGRLAGDLGPVSRWTVPRRLFLGLGFGAAASAFLVIAGLGLRPDLAGAARTPEFWVKLVYTLAMCAIGLWIASRAVRPAGETFWRTTAVPFPLLAVGFAASLQSVFDDSADWKGLFWGSTALTCPWLVVLCSLGPLAGLIWAARGCAPTEISQAGAALGLAAGGMGGALYSFHCTEPGMSFLGAWYTLGLALVVLVGCAVGPRFVHW
jgi:hypothetical protein